MCIILTVAIQIGKPCLALHCLALFVGDLSEGMRGAHPPSSIGLETTDLLFVCKLSRQELVTLICFRRRHHAATNAPEYKSASPSLSPPHLLFSVFLV